MAQTQKPFNALDYQLQKRPKAAKLDSTRFADHTFFSAALGTEAVLAGRLNVGESLGMKMQLQVGKWFTSTHGMRIGLESSINQRYKGGELPIHLGLTADYLYNLSSHVWGYNPNRPFEVTFVAGLGGHYNIYEDNDGISLGIGTGFRGDVRLSPMIDLFVEPKLNFYTNGFYPTAARSWVGGYWSPSLMAGVTYKMVSRADRHHLSNFLTKPFGENLFLSVGGGAEFMLSSTNSLSSSRPVGMGGSLAIGSWISPSSGIRLTAGSGYSGIIAANSTQEITLKRVTGQFDYLLSLNPMFGGYRRDEWFNLYAILGLNANMSQRFIPDNRGDGNSERFFQLGGGLGLQANFQVHDNVSLYLEPRLNVYPNTMAGGVTHHRFDALAQVMAGVTYRRTEREKRLQNGTANFSSRDQWFLEAGVGLNAILSSDLGELGFQAMKPLLTVGVGKWFNHNSALRFKLGAGYLGEVGQGGDNRTEIIATDLDYLFSLTNLMNGYNPKRRFAVNGVVGLSAIFNSGTTPEPGGSKLNAGVGVGLQGMINVTPAFGIYLEPRVTGYLTNDLARGDVGIFPIDVMGSMTAGLSYRFQMVDKATNRLGVSADNHARGFISLAGGVNGLVQPGGVTRDFAPSFYAGFGKWITPLAAFRIGAEGALIPEEGNANRYTEYAAIGADFMTSLSNMVTPYRHDRIFNLNAFAGASWGAVYTGRRSDNFATNDFNAFVPSVRAGLQASFRVSDAIELYLEPQLSFFPLGNLEYRNEIRNDLLYTARAGITYRIMSGNMAVTTKRFRNSDFMANTFASTSMGVGAYAERLSAGLSKELWTIESALSFGKWFNNLSGARLTVYNSNIDDTSSKAFRRYDMTMIGIHLDYMLNMSNLLSGSYEDRKFEVIGIIGMGYDHVSASNDKGSAFGGSVNVQGLYNINKQWGAYIEPSAMLFLNKVTGRDFLAGYKLNGVAKVMVGTQYRF